MNIVRFMSALIYTSASNKHNHSTIVFDDTICYTVDSERSSKMKPELELTGTPEQVANEIANTCIREPSYTPDPNAFRSIVEWMWANPGKTYADYRKEQMR